MSWNRIALAATLTAGLTASVGADNRIPLPDVPDLIQAPADSKLFLVGHALGTQNYICAPAATATGVDWLFIGPQATLFDEDGRQIVTHFFSRNPDKNFVLNATWQHSRDTSAVWATKLRGSTDAAFVAPDAIEWLLLEKAGARVGPAGGDKLSKTKFIQRINTVGGVKPPSAECTPARLNIGKYVPYEADYYFYK